MSVPGSVTVRSAGPAFGLTAVTNCSAFSLAVLSSALACDERSQIAFAPSSANAIATITAIFEARFTAVESLFDPASRLDTGTTESWILDMVILQAPELRHCVGNASCAGAQKQ